MDRLIDCGYDGIYIDDVFPFGDWNLEPVGTSYLFASDQGVPAKHCGSAAGEYRDYLKRLYNLYHAHGKRPIITTHMTSTLGWPYHSFVTVAFDHEQSARFAADNTTFMDAWPLDYLMTLDNPERSGVVTVPMLKGAYIEDRTPLQQWSARRSFAAVWMLFDLNLPLHRSVLEPYYGTDVEVYPFWRNEHIVSLEPVIGEPVTERDLPKPKWWNSKHFRASLAEQPLRATVYKKNNRCLLLLANFLRRAVGCKATLDFDALGIPPAARNRVTVFDVDKDRPPGEVDLAVLHLDDLKKGSKPPTVGDVTAGPDGILADSGDDMDVVAMLEGDERAGKREQFFAVQHDGNTITLQVAAHNYRAVELRW
jgi:hypothetical protein